jgi:hypothetical protein
MKMSKKEKATQLAKFTALNSIKKMYHPLYKTPKYYYWDSETWEEYRDREVQRIVENLETELKQIREKYEL